MNNGSKKRSSSGLLLEVWRRFKKNRLSVIALALLLIIIFIAIFAPFLTPYEYDKQDLSNALSGPTSEHVLGTDNYGRDMYTRIIYGGRTSLFIAIAVVGISSGLGCLFGAVAGYFKKLDNLIMRLVDVLAGIPSMLLAIALAASFGSGLRNLILALGISYAPACIRIVRASVMGIREQDFVEAATGIGAGNTRIIFRHIMPNALSPIIVQSTMNVSRAIISSSTLSFLGLGVQSPTSEWGSMLAVGRAYIQQYPHMILIPGIAIFITTYALNLFGDGLRDALDPRLKN